MWGFETQFKTNTPIDGNGIETEDEARQIHENVCLETRHIMSRDSITIKLKC